MRPVLGPLVVVALLMAAGLGLLSAVTPVLASWRRAIGAAGLAYLLGVAAVGIIDIALLAAGVSVDLPVFVVTCVAVAAGGGLAGWRLRPARAAAAPRLAAGEARLESRWAIALGTLLAAFAVITLLRYVQAPLDGWDAWTIWNRKAIVLLNSGSIDPRLFTTPQFAFSHQDYPLLLPFLESIHYRAIGELNTQSVHFVFWTLLVAFPWALGSLASRGGRPLLWAPIVLAAATAPAYFTLLGTAYADAPLAIFLATGTLALGYWIEAGNRADLAVAIVLLAGAASIKNEGFIAAILVLVVAAIVTLRGVARRRRLELGVAALVFLVAVAPWRIWLAAHHVHGDVSLKRAVSPDVLLHSTNRIWLSIDALYFQLQNQGRWLYLLPLSLLVAGAAIALRICRRAAAFYLLSGVGFYVALVWVYWSSTNEIHWYLDTSASRVVEGIAAIAIAALLHLAPRLASTPPDPAPVATTGEHSDHYASPALRAGGHVA